MERRLALLAVLATAAIPATASGSSGTLAGKLADGKLPSATAGRSVIRAISAADGHVAAATELPRSGRWKLNLDPGYYVLSASTVTTSKTQDSIAPIERVRGGRTTRTTVSLKRTKTPRAKKNRRKRRRSARSAAASPAVGVRPFTSSDSDLGRGLANMVIEELANTQSGDCTPTVVEVEHRADILKEIALANSGLVDPSSRVPAGHLIDPAFYVQGTVHFDGSSTTWDLEIVDASTGKPIGGDSGTAQGTDVFSAPAGIAQRIADQICGGDYQVTVDIGALVAADSYVGSGRAISIVPVRPADDPPTIWMGQAEVVFNGLSYGGVPGCDVVPTPHTGTVRVEIHRSQTPGMIEVTWGGESFAGTNLVCPGATIPNGVPPIQPFQGTVPTLLILPESGGTQSVAGGLGGAGAGWTNSGTVTVTRFPRGSL